MNRDENYSRPGLLEWLIGSFAVLDIVFGATMRWNDVPPWVEGIPESHTHRMLSAAIYLVDAALVVAVVLWSVWSRRPERRSLRSLLRHSPWIAATLGAGLAWVELWFAAVHHAGYHVNGGFAAALVFGGYVAWRVPIGNLESVWLRVLMMTGTDLCQSLALEWVEESWRLWH